MKRDVIILGGISVLIISVIVGYIINPHLVYDKWIWKYYWGPVVADALGREVSYNGIIAHEGYTLVSEITYGIAALVALYYLYKLLKILGIKIDWNLFISLIPFFIFGSVSRALEDANYFRIPLSYWFISPLIYVQIAIYFVVSVIFGWIFERKKRMYLLLIYGIIISLVYTIFWLFYRGLVCNSLHPAVIVGIYTISASVIYLKRKTGPLPVVYLIGITISLSGILALGYVMINREIRIDVFSICLFIPSIVVTIFILISKWKEKLSFLGKPLNLSMLFGHSLDGFTSYISIYDPLHLGITSYGEKHPVSYALMSVSNGILYPIIKIVLILLIIYIFEEYEKKEDNTNMVNLMKISVFILGFSPGLRDLLRVTMGV